MIRRPEVITDEGLEGLSIGKILAAAEDVRNAHVAEDRPEGIDGGTVL